MTVEQTPRIGVTTWSSDADIFTRSQMNSSHNNIESFVAGFIQDNTATPPDAESKYTGFFYYSSIDTNEGTLYYCNGSEWFDVSITDHGGLTGLADDDHPQYLLASGTRPATSLTVTGNITVGGKVDGRDIAADGVKLDSIDLNSLSLSPSEILSRLKTVDGPNSGLDADLLDGVHASGFALVAHSHMISNITGLQTALDSKQPFDSDLNTIANANNGSVLAATTASFTIQDETRIDDLWDTRRDSLLLYYMI